MSVDDIAASFNQLEQELDRIVKATVESTLGRVGNNGAIAVNDFIGQLQSVMQEIVNVGVVRAPGLGGDAVELPMTPSRPFLGSVVCPGDVSISSRQGSLVPSAFGDGLSVGPSSMPNATAAKPGKRTDKIMGGVLVISVFKLVLTTKSFVFLEGLS